MIVRIFTKNGKVKRQSPHTALRRCRLCCQPVAGFEALCPRCAKRAATAPGFRLLPHTTKGGHKHEN